MPQNAPPWLTIGWLIALLVLLGAFVLALIGGLDLKLAVMLGGLALARLVP